MIPLFSFYDQTFPGGLTHRVTVGVPNGIENVALGIVHELPIHRLFVARWYQSHYMSQVTRVALVPE